MRMLLLANAGMLFAIANVSCSQPRCEVNILPDLAVDLRRIGVLDLVDAPGADAGHSGRVVAGVISSRALGVAGWSVLERQQLTRVVQEQDLQATDLVDPATAVRVGELVGADGIIVGEVAQYRIGSIPFLFFVTWDQDVYKVDLSFRLIAVRTGEVCLTAHVSATSLESFERAITDGLMPTFQQIDSRLRRIRSTGAE